MLSFSYHHLFPTVQRERGIIYREQIMQNLMRLFVEREIQGHEKIVEIRKADARQFV